MAKGIPMVRLSVFAALAVVGLALSAEECFAQGRNAALNTQRALLNRPTVSPYLNLLQPQGNGLPNYQTLVKPAIDQRRRDQETQRQIYQLQSSVAANTARETRGESTFRPTGHTTTFFYHSHFYPALGQRRR
jgi:hypothetical protein